MLCSSTILHVIFIHSTNIWVPSVYQTWGWGGNNYSPMSIFISLNISSVVVILFYSELSVTQFHSFGCFKQSQHGRGSYLLSKILHTLPLVPIKKGEAILTIFHLSPPSDMVGCRCLDSCWRSAGFPTSAFGSSLQASTWWKTHIISYYYNENSFELSERVWAWTPKVDGLYFENWWTRWMLGSYRTMTCFLYTYLFVWQCRVLVAAQGIFDFHCGMRDL